MDGTALNKRARNFVPKLFRHAQKCHTNNWISKISVKFAASDIVRLRVDAIFVIYYTHTRGHGW